MSFDEIRWVIIHSWVVLATDLVDYVDFSIILISSSVRP